MPSRTASPRRFQTASLSDIVYWVARHEILDIRLWNLLRDISTIRKIDCFEWCYRVSSRRHWLPAKRCRQFISEAASFLFGSVFGKPVCGSHQFRSSSRALGAFCNRFYSCTRCSGRSHSSSLASLLPRDCMPSGTAKVAHVGRDQNVCRVPIAGIRVAGPSQGSSAEEDAPDDGAHWGSPHYVATPAAGVSAPSRPARRPCL